MMRRERRSSIILTLGMAVWLVSPAEADWAEAGPEFGGSYLHCIDSVGEWGDDFFCLGFRCDGNEMRLLHVAAGGDLLGRGHVIIEKGRGAEDAVYEVSFAPEPQISSRTGTIVESAPVTAQFWQDVTRSHTIRIGTGDEFAHPTAGLENYSSALLRRCKPR